MSIGKTMLENSKLLFGSALEEIRQFRTSLRKGLKEELRTVKEGIAQTPSVEPPGAQPDEYIPSNPLDCKPAEVARWNKEWLRYLEREWRTQLTPHTNFQFPDTLPNTRVDMLGLKFAENHTLRLFCDRDWLVGKKVLELGCGCGNMGKLLGCYVNEYVGVDYSELALKIARLVSPGNCHYLHLSETNQLAELTGTVDTWVSRFFWIHQNMQLARWNMELGLPFLRKGGRIYADFYFGNPKVRQGVVRPPSSKLSRKYPSATFQYTDQDVEKLIDGLDLTVLDIEVSTTMQRRYVTFEKTA